MREFARLAFLTLIVIALCLVGTGSGGQPDDAHDDHDDHDDHAAQAASRSGAGAVEPDGPEGHGHDETAQEPEPEDGHDGHEPDGHDEEAGAHEPEDAHDEEAGAHGPEDDHGGSPAEGEAQYVELTAEQRSRIGLETAVAGPGSIGKDLSFPGEVVLNPDRVAHVVPRAAGIVREVTKTLGDTVEADEILAWIESAELSEAKLDFYAKEAVVGCCEFELPRAREIFENVNRLLDLLEKSPSIEALRKLDGLEMGEYRGRLITAHAAFVAARAEFERERTLREKSISSEMDLVAAQAEIQRAEAELNAVKDAARYEVLVAFGEQARARQVSEFEAVAAEQKLRQKGVDEATIQNLRRLVPKTSGLKPCLCTDPDCTDNEFPSVRDTLGKDMKLGWYPLRAPFAGVVMEKHLTLGEKVGEDESVFAIADTSTVWVDFGVFQKDLANVKPGQSVEVEVTGSQSHHPGKIAYLSPVLDPETRTAHARMVLANDGDRLRPGLFVTVRVAMQAVHAAVIVPRSAVQILDEMEVVFVEEGDEFMAVPVRLGRGDRNVVEITHGLKRGQRYVKQGAFELKAKIATSGLDAHAGHGH